MDTCMEELQKIIFWLRGMHAKGTDFGVHAWIKVQKSFCAFRILKLLKGREAIALKRQLAKQNLPY